MLAKGGKKNMKKFIILAALFATWCSMANNIFAQENDPVLVCHFEETENGELIEVCEETSTYQLCTPECWGT